MNTAQTISAQVERLPLKLQEEVLYFIKYLVFRNSIESTVPEQQTDNNKTSRRSILELRGLGKHLWKDTSVKDYINAERDSWDGQMS
jgi:hypothetical protein